MRPFHPLLLLALSITAPLASAANCTATSPAHKIAVVELFTSEGCDSCPPADRWLNALPQTGFSSDKVIALAFHLDHWDGLGWKDRFAQKAFDQRLREKARYSGPSGAMYTPQVMLDGKDTFAWRKATEFKRAVDAKNAQRAPLGLSVNANRVGQTLNIEAALRDLKPGARAQLRLSALLVEDGLASDVTAGENKGVRLQHDQVVRAIASLAPHEKGTLHATLRAPDETHWDRSSVVVLAENARGEVLQAVKVRVCD